MDINDNQKTMNTAHLAHLKARLTGPEKLAVEDPALWIAERLTDDPKSPWHGIVHKGGQRTQGLKRRVNLAALKTGIGMTLHDAVKLRSVDPIEGKYVLIRMFWNAVARIYAGEWADQKSMLLKGIGIWTFSQLGAEVIDRCLVRGVPAPRWRMKWANTCVRRSSSSTGEAAVTFRATGVEGCPRAANKMKAALSDEDINISQIAAAVRNMA